MKVILSACCSADSSSLPGPPTEDKSVGHVVFRGEQKAQTASYLMKSPGTASACEGLIELGNCDRVPRDNGVEADKRFLVPLRGTENLHKSIHHVQSILLGTQRPLLTHTHKNKVLASDTTKP